MKVWLFFFFGGWIMVMTVSCTSSCRRRRVCPLSRSARSGDSTHLIILVFPPFFVKLL
ncbi:hypothetical protein HU200_005923 [Digitaria exilis]|uniref:Uncharacterized protein n=1 Tax=Digitaria exilis TaxID=1010633 RepID=A0A835FR50_9POAL|nr:hypothetical protein HU200_005923 [Digitaria exilis]